MFNLNLNVWFCRLFETFICCVQKSEILPINRDLADYLVFVYLGDDSVVAFDFVGHALEVIVI